MSVYVYVYVHVYIYVHAKDTATHKYGKLYYMKTTIDIPDELYRKAKIAAIENGTTLRELVVVGLAKEIEPKAQKAEYPSLKDNDDKYEMDDMGFLVLKRKYGDNTVITNEFINQMREELGI